MEKIEAGFSNDCSLCQAQDCDFIACVENSLTSSDRDDPTGVRSNELYALSLPCRRDPPSISCKLASTNLLPVSSFSFLPFGDGASSRHIFPLGDRKSEYHSSEPTVSCISSELSLVLVFRGCRLFRNDASAFKSPSAQSSAPRVESTDSILRRILCMDCTLFWGLMFGRGGAPGCRFTISLLSQLCPKLEHKKYYYCKFHSDSWKNLLK